MRRCCCCCCAIGEDCEVDCSEIARLLLRMQFFLLSGLLAVFTSSLSWKTVAMQLIRCGRERGVVYELIASRGGSNIMEDCAGCLL